MTITTQDTTVQLKNPIVLVNDSTFPRHAMLVDLREDQKRDLGFFENLRSYAGTINRFVNVGYYQPGSSNSYTHSPLELNQVAAVCPDFVIDNYHTSFLDLFVLINASQLEQQLFNAVRPPPSVKQNLTWCIPENLRLDIKIGTEGQSRFIYSFLGTNLLEVNSHVNSFRNKMDLFLPFIRTDDTGCYQIPTPQLLEERVEIAKNDARKIDDYSFRYRFQQYGTSRPYHKSLEAAKNVARRLNPPRKVFEKEIEDAYDSKWNEILQERLPDMLIEMQLGLSQLLRNPQCGKTAPFFDKYSHSIDIIIDRLSRGVVSLDQISMQELGKVIVLNNLYEQSNNQARVDKIHDDIVRNQSDIEALASRSRDLLKELQSVQVEAGTESINLENEMKKRLGKVIPNESEIDSLISNTKPIEIPDEPEDEIPF